MKIHHLNCGTLIPRPQTKIPCHCLLIESRAGLILADTGIGLQDIETPSRRLGWVSCKILKPALRLDETAFFQIRKLGFSPKDVRHILLTHLDLDHAGGLSDFPWAQVHLMKDEYEAAAKPRTLLERFRYRLPQFEHSPRWERCEIQGDRWMGFECVRPLEGLREDVFLLPLPGHTRGHAAVGVKTDDASHGPRWIVLAGDAYYYRGEIHHETPHCPKDISLMERIMAHNNELRLANQRRLRELAREKAGEVRVFCSHDPVEMERLIQ